MSTALKPIQDVKPAADPHLWSCYYGPSEGVKQRLPVKEIASALGISIWTVHNHLKHIYEKLNVHTRTEALLKYLQK